MTDIKDTAPSGELKDAVAATLTDEAEPKRGFGPWGLAGLGVVIVLGLIAGALNLNLPKVNPFFKQIDFPIYAIVIGLIGNAILSATGLRDKLSPGFRTEFLIKTGLVLLGASINFAVIVKAAGPAIAQALLLISLVFFFTWWVGKALGVDDRLRALLSTAVSICGVSAAIAAAGAVKAKRDDLAYVASLVVIFALPSIFLLPWLANLLGLAPAVAGAWIGGNIDTTAAVAAAGTLAGEAQLQVATIVKATQNALIGVVAILLTVVFALRTNSTGDAAPKVTAGLFWQRFPKFVLGFLAASIIATIFISSVSSEVSGPAIGVANTLRTWFLLFAFTSIGLEFKVSNLRAAGWRPALVFGLAVVWNLVVGLGLAVLLWNGFEV